MNSSGTNTQPNSFTIPAYCSHGIAWSQPCASCGRPYVAPASVENVRIDTAPLVEPLSRIADALARIAAVMENRHAEEIKARQPMGGASE